MIMEFNKAGELIWTLSNADLNGEPLKFMSGFQYLPESDSFVITNWQGHKISRKGPHIMHVSRDKQILQSIGDSPDIVTISSIFIPGAQNSKAVH